MKLLDYGKKLTRYRGGENMIKNILMEIIICLSIVLFNGHMEKEMSKKMYEIISRVE